MIAASLTDHLEKLRYFCEIARSGSLGKAAKALRVAQPTLSHSVKILETVLATSLLVRTSHGVQLTPAGQRLLEFSQKLLSDTSALEHELRLGKEGGWTFSVGTKEPYAVSLWPEYLRGLRSRYPEIDVSLSIDRSNHKLVERLSRQHVDAIFIAEPEEDEHIVAYEIFSDHFGFFSVSGKDRDSLFIFRDSLCGNHRNVDDVLKESLFRDVPRISDVDSFPAAKAMALAGLGVALLPHSLAKAELSTRRLKPCTVSGLPASLFGSIKVCLCLHKKDVGNRRLRELIRFLRGLC